MEGTPPAAAYPPPRATPCTVYLLRFDSSEVCMPVPALAPLHPLPCFRCSPRRLSLTEWQMVERRDIVGTGWPPCSQVGMGCLNATCSEGPSGHHRRQKWVYRVCGAPRIGCCTSSPRGPRGGELGEGQGSIILPQPGHQSRPAVGSGSSGQSWGRVSEALPTPRVPMAALSWIPSL